MGTPEKEGGPAVASRAAQVRSRNDLSPQIVGESSAPVNGARQAPFSPFLVSNFRPREHVCHDYRETLASDFDSYSLRKEDPGTAVISIRPFPPLLDNLVETMVEYIERRRKVGRSPLLHAAIVGGLAALYNNEAFQRYADANSKSILDLGERTAIKEVQDLRGILKREIRIDLGERRGGPGEKIYVHSQVTGFLNEISNDLRCNLTEITLLCIARYGMDQPQPCVPADTAQKLRTAVRDFLRFVGLRAHLMACMTEYVLNDPGDIPPCAPFNAVFNMVKHAGESD